VSPVFSTFSILLNFVFIRLLLVCRPFLLTLLLSPQFLLLLFLLFLFILQFSSPLYSLPAHSSHYFLFTYFLLVRLFWFLKLLSPFLRFSSLSLYSLFLF
jgi:hypothetical protein